MKFGLSENIIESMNAIFEENSKIDKVIVFGSRAKGNNKETDLMSASCLHQFHNWID